MNLREQLALKLAQAKTAYEAGNVEEGDKLKGEAETIKAAIDGMAALGNIEESVRSAPLRPALPGVGQGAQPAPEAPAQPQEDGSSAVKAVYTLRFGDETAAKTAVMQGVVGKDYQQTLLEQQHAFGRYLRGGDMALDRDQVKLLKMQIFAFEDIEQMVCSGYGVAEIKSTMVEAQGTLGGFAVPSVMQSEIIRRLPGLTAVRGGGARVINLTTGNSTEILEVTGGNDRYTSGLRGAWGSETQSPAEKNLTLGLKSVNADIYTYKVPMSQSLVEDAANLVSVLQDEAAMTMAMDEDEAFLIGDGVGKPYGILPGSANALGLTEVVSASASALTANGLKALKRGIASQYRQGSTWVANSDTYGAVERLIDGQGQYLFPDLNDTDTLLGRRIYESEAMPDVASSAYPIIFGNMAGYYIVERSGMAIARYQDSNTGINKVEFHFRRRVGGRVAKTWMFAVQKIAAS
jgi:HK97 family phage major capsid protein